MTETPTTPEPDFDVAALKVTSLIASARRLLGEQRMVDLTALEGKVRTLCDAARQLPASEDGRMKATVKAIMDDLGRLQEDLDEQYRAVAEHIERTTRGPALEAYAKTQTDS